MPKNDIIFNSTQHTAHSTQHTAHSTQHTAHSTQHTAHSTQHTRITPFYFCVINYITSYSNKAVSLFIMRGNRLFALFGGKVGLLS